MNNKITFQKFAAEVASRLGEDASATERRLSRLFEEISKELLETGEARLPHVGTFRADTSGISFVPTDSLKQGVNAPFEMFDAVELNPEVTDHVLAEGASARATEETPETSDAINASEPNVSAVPEETKEPKEIIVSAVPKEPEEIIVAAVPKEPEEIIVTAVPKDPEEIIVAAVPKDPKEIIVAAVPKEPVGSEIPKTTADREFPVQTEATVAPAEPDCSEAADTPAESGETSGWMMFILGLIVGLAIGVAVCFYYYALTATTVAPDPDEDIESVE